MVTETCAFNFQFHGLFDIVTIVLPDQTLTNLSMILIRRVDRWQ